MIRNFYRFKHKFYWAIILLQIILACMSAWNKTWTIDEPNHLRYGRQILEKHSFDRFDNSKMSISMVNAVARKIYFHFTETPDPQWLKMISRLPSILMGAGISCCMYWWVYELIGFRSALISLIMVAFEPNLLAHSRWVTTDIPVTFFVFITGYFLFRWMTSSRRLFFVFSGLTAGCALSSKFSSFLFLPLLLGIVFKKKTVETYASNNNIKIDKSRCTRVMRLLIFSVILYGTVCVLNGCHNLGKSIGKVDWHTDMLLRIAQKYPDIPLIIPENIVQGLDWNLFDDNQPVEVYFKGKIYTEPVPEYFPVAFLLKTPLPILILLFLSMLKLIVKIVDGNIEYVKRVAWALIPGLYFFILISMFLRSQLGIRFLLPVYPFLVLFIAGLFENTKQKALLITACCFLLWEVLSTLSFFPHLLPYCNELVGRRIDFYKYLADSNIDWGQDWWYVQKEKKKYEGTPFSIAPKSPEYGIVCVRVDELVGLLGPPKRYEWIRVHYRPFDHIGYSFLLFKIPPRDMLLFSRPKRLDPIDWKASPSLIPGLIQRYVRGLSGNNYMYESKVSHIPVISETFKTPFSAPFRYEWTAFWKVNEEGIYTLGTESDDGSQIWINSEPVVDNGGSHAVRFLSRLISLKKGFYHIEVQYDDRGGNRFFKFHCMKLIPETKSVQPEFYIFRRKIKGDGIIQ